MLHVIRRLPPVMQRALLALSVAGLIGGSYLLLR